MRDRGYPGISFNIDRSLFRVTTFAFYYFLQCLVAIVVAESKALKIIIGVLAAVLFFITLFAVPAG